MATTAFTISASDSEWNLTPSHDQPTRKNAFPYVMEEDKPSAISKPTSSGSIIGPVYSLASDGHFSSRQMTTDFLESHAYVMWLHSGVESVYNDPPMGQ